MEIFILLFMFALPVAFLVWTLRFKGVLAFVAIAPLMMINVVVISMNSGYDQDNPPALEYTHTDFGCATINSTQIGCLHESVTEKYAIGFQNMNILNSLVGVFTIAVVFVVFRRVTRYRKRDPDE